MDFHRFMGAVRQVRWLVLAIVIVSTAGAAAAAYTVAARYQSSVTFFVSVTQGYTGGGLTADQYAERRIDSYSVLLTSQRMGQAIAGSPGVGLSPEDVVKRISAAPVANTVLLKVTTEDTDKARSLAITTAVAAKLQGVIHTVDPVNTSLSTRLQVISGPRAAASPVYPPKAVFIGLGLLAGLLIAFSVAFLRELLDTSVRSVGDIDRIAGGDLVRRIDLPSSLKPTPLIAESSDTGVFAESVRQLRTSVLFANATKQVSVVVVTSARADEGKTTVAANLALVLAEATNSVLLIDANLRRPKAGALLGKKDGAGLTSVLTGDASLDEALQMRADGLSVLSAGPTTSNPSEMLSSRQMSDLLDELRARFRLIVIDVPELLAVTDAVVASTLADAVLLVIRRGRTKRGDLDEAVRHLRVIDAQLFGVAVIARPGDRLGEHVAPVIPARADPFAGRVHRTPSRR